MLSTIIPLITNDLELDDLRSLRLTSRTIESAVPFDEYFTHQRIVFSPSGVQRLLDFSVSRFQHCIRHLHIAADIFPLTKSATQLTPFKIILPYLPIQHITIETRPCAVPLDWTRLDQQSLIIDTLLNAVVGELKSFSFTALPVASKITDQTRDFITHLADRQSRDQHYRSLQQSLDTESPRPAAITRWTPRKKFVELCQAQSETHGFQPLDFESLSDHEVAVHVVRLRRKIEARYHFLYHTRVYDSLKGMTMRVQRLTLTNVIVNNGVVHILSPDTTLVSVIMEGSFERCFETWKGRRLRLEALRENNQHLLFKNENTGQYGRYFEQHGDVSMPAYRLL